MGSRFPSPPESAQQDLPWPQIPQGLTTEADAQGQVPRTQGPGHLGRALERRPPAVGLFPGYGRATGRECPGPGRGICEGDSGDQEASEGKQVPTPWALQSGSCQGAEQ
jgi:hypothetical protein